MLVDGWYDLVLGSRCVGCDRPGRLLCPACRAALRSAAVPVRNPLLAGWPVYAAGEYDGVLRAMVLAHKERTALGLTGALGSVLAGVVAAVEPERDVLIVPVPSSRRATRERGHDPMLRIARAAAGVLRREGRYARAVAALTQRAGVRDQAGLASADRIANLEGAHRVRSSVARQFAEREAAVVVCDDVVTTGATAREARRALAAAGAPPAAFAAIAVSRRRQST